MRKVLRLLGDPTRLRLLSLLDEGELSVIDLQEILGMGQSRISAQLSQLRGAGAVESRKSGKNMMYRLDAELFCEEEGKALRRLVKSALEEMPEAADDHAALELLKSRQSDRARMYFNELAGKFGTQYCPGRSWKALAEALLQVMPPVVIADLGAGEATFSQLLAQRAERVIAVDNSENMVTFGRDAARRNGVANLDYRLGDLQKPPIGDGKVDVTFFSQALHHAVQPERAVQEAWRILKPGGQIVILDLLRHQFEEARELYADKWLGFTEVNVQKWLTDTGFQEIRIEIVDREEEAPHFQTLLGVGRKPL